MEAEGVTFCRRERKGQRWGGGVRKIEDGRKEVKRGRGQQLASAGLKLTLSFYEGV